MKDEKGGVRTLNVWPALSLVALLGGPFFIFTRPHCHLLTCMCFLGSLNHWAKMRWALVGQSGVSLVQEGLAWGPLWTQKESNLRSSLWWGPGVGQDAGGEAGCQILVWAEPWILGSRKSRPAEMKCFAQDLLTAWSLPPRPCPPYSWL